MSYFFFSNKFWSPFSPLHLETLWMSPCPPRWLRPLAVYSMGDKSSDEHTYPGNCFGCRGHQGLLRARGPLYCNTWIPCMHLMDLMHFLVTRTFIMTISRHQSQLPLITIKTEFDVKIPADAVWTRAVWDVMICADLMWCDLVLCETWRYVLIWCDVISCCVRCDDMCWSDVVWSRAVWDVTICADPMWFDLALWKYPGLVYSYELFNLTICVDVMWQCLCADVTICQSMCECRWWNLQMYVMWQYVLKWCDNNMCWCDVTIPIFVCVMWRHLVLSAMWWYLWMSGTGRNLDPVTWKDYTKAIYGSIYIYNLS